MARVVGRYLGPQNQHAIIVVVKTCIIFCLPAIRPESMRSAGSVPTSRPDRNRRWLLNQVLLQFAARDCERVQV